MADYRVDSLDLAKEIDLQHLERLMLQHPKHTIDIIYCSCILIEWEDQFGTIHIAYFERQSQEDMRIAEDILNKRPIIVKDAENRRLNNLICQNVIRQELDVKFPFAFFKWDD